MKSINGEQFRAAVKTAAPFIGRRRDGYGYFNLHVVARLRSDSCTIIGTDGCAMIEIPLKWSGNAKTEEQWVRFKARDFAKGKQDVTLHQLREADAPWDGRGVAPERWPNLVRGPHKLKTSLNVARWAADLLSIKRCWISNDALAGSMWRNQEQMPRVMNMAVSCDEFPDRLEIGLGVNYLRKIFAIFPGEITVSVGGPTDVVCFESGETRVWVMPLRPDGKR